MTTEVSGQGMQVRVGEGRTEVGRMDWVCDGWEMGKFGLGRGQISRHWYPVNPNSLPKPHQLSSQLLGKNSLTQRRWGYLFWSHCISAGEGEH